MDDRSTKVDEGEIGGEEEMEERREGRDGEKGEWSMSVYREGLGMINAC